MHEKDDDNFSPAEYSEVWDQFFESLILLNRLGQARGPHTSSRHEDTLRSILDSLAYICDFEKSGATVTAIALEKTSCGHIFWIASNSTQSGQTNVRFLESAIEHIREVISAPASDRTQAAERFVDHCLAHASRRIREECRGFAHAYSKFTGKRPGGDRTAYLLARLVICCDEFDLCRRAYRQRHDELFRLLRAASNDFDFSASKVRHCLGRLAHHIRAPTQILDDFERDFELRRLLHRSSVRLVPEVECVPRPNPIRTPMVFNGEELSYKIAVLRRMMPAENPTAKIYATALRRLEKRKSLREGMLTAYDDPDFKPSVHCEIQVLEHFYNRRLEYVNNNRYIGCSKPACYCCHLYIKNHPARVAIPPTHQKIYLNWGLRRITESDYRAHLNMQRYMLSKMMEEIRAGALAQIGLQARPRRVHADSVTNITDASRSNSIAVPAPTTMPLAMGFMALPSRSYSLQSTSTTSAAPGGTRLQPLDEAGEHFTF